MGGAIVKNQAINQKMNKSKVRVMQNSSEVFKSNFDYYQRVAHEKFSFRFSHIPISDWCAFFPIHDVTEDFHWSS